MLMKER